MWDYTSLYPLALCVKKIPLNIHSITFPLSTGDPVREEKKFGFPCHENWSWPWRSRWAESSTVHLSAKFMSYLGNSGSEVFAPSLTLSSKTQVPADCRGKQCRNSSTYSRLWMILGIKLVKTEIQCKIRNKISMTCLAQYPAFFISFSAYVAAHKTITKLWV